MLTNFPSQFSIQTLDGNVYDKFREVLKFISQTELDICRQNLDPFKKILEESAKVWLQLHFCISG